MRKVNDVYSFLCELAPTELQMSFDNAGFLVGRRDAQVSKVLLSLDVTSDVVREAINGSYQLIISHHPVIFTALKNITDNILLELCENKVAAISMHTNLDIAEGGVNDCLLSLIGAERTDYLDSDNCGRVGKLPEEMSMDDFLKICRDKLHTNGLRYYDSGKPVRRVAVLGGSGGSELEAAFEKGCDTYLTSDIKYNQFLTAKELGINLIDGDHFGTEDPIMYGLCDKLTAHFPDLVFDIAKSHGPIIRFA